MQISRVIRLLLGGTTLLALVLPSSGRAKITFERTYGGLANDGGYSVDQTLDGGYIVSGYADLGGT